MVGSREPPAAPPQAHLPAPAPFRFVDAMLLTLVIIYLLGTIAIGLWAARRVKSTADYAIAGRHLPLAMIITTTFATWFGAETVLGIPAKFVPGGLNRIGEDPFGAGTC